jgi:hypothetical protein
VKDGDYDLENGSDLLHGQVDGPQSIYDATEILDVTLAIVPLEFLTLVEVMEGREVVTAPVIPLLLR